MDEIGEKLSTQMRRALADAVSETIGDADVDEHEPFRAFKSAVRSKCSTWERVPDRFVQTDDGKPLG